MGDADPTPIDVFPDVRASAPRSGATAPPPIIDIDHSARPHHTAAFRGNY